MNQFKNETLACTACKKTNFVKIKDFEAGFYVCSHKDCGVKNVLTGVFYDPIITKGLPQFGMLVAADNPTDRYPLLFGENAVGRGIQADVRLKAKTHNGQIFMSRHHCTITVSFDKWAGELKTTIKDGALDLDSATFEASKNGTFRNNKKIESVEEHYLNHNDTINLGGSDAFRFEAYTIPAAMLDTYKKTNKIDPEGTL
jgi:pSer/pThr/pTyr-binding forkhead associated (FHA) protein